MVHLQSVYRLLTRKGTTSYSLVKVTPVSMDTNDPTASPTLTEATHSLLSYPGQYTKNQIDGETIKTEDIKMYVSPTDLAVAPTKTDKITDGTNEWNIIHVKKYTEQDIVALYILQLRN